MIRIFIFSILTLYFSSSAFATVLTFEDIIPYPTGNAPPVGSVYPDFIWTDILAESGKKARETDTSPSHVYDPNGYEQGAVSGEMVVYSNIVYTVSNPTGIEDTWTSISLAGPGSFDYVGAYWTSAWMGTNLPYHTISFEGWANGTKLFDSDSYSLTMLTPLWIGLNWNGIDQLKIKNSTSTSWQSQWAMDNFTFNQDVILPEPAPFALLALGLLGIGIMRRKRR